MSRPILRLLAAAAIVVVLLAVLAFAAGRAGRASSTPATPTTTTIAGAAYVPDPAGPPVTDPNGKWLPEPDLSSSAGGER